jgi:hypothetical protein
MHAAQRCFQHRHHGAAGVDWQLSRLAAPVGPTHALTRICTRVHACGPEPAHPRMHTLLCVSACQCPCICACVFLCVLMHTCVSASACVRAGLYLVWGSDVLLHWNRDVSNTKVAVLPQSIGNCTELQRLCVPNPIPIPFTPTLFCELACMRIPSFLLRQSLERSRTDAM